MRAPQSTCAFTGHRPQKLPWRKNENDTRCIALKAKLRDAVENAYQDGITHFICGMAKGCDLYFGEIVLSLKERYPDITLEAAIPCPTQTEGWTEAEKERYNHLLACCDAETMVQDHYAPGCMQRRNKYMVDHAGMLIAVYDGYPGGTMRTIEYAMRRGLDIVDIAPTMEEE